MKNLTNKAFTTIELIFVIVILGILATVAIPKFMATHNQATEANVKEQIQAIRASIQSERMERIVTDINDSNDSNDGNLTLYYNYRPWEGQKYTDGNSSLIMQNVDTFQYKAVGDLIKVQLCIKDGNISSDGGYSVCKEKTIF